MEKVKIIDIHPRDSFYSDRVRLIGITGEWAIEEEADCNGFRGGKFTFDKKQLIPSNNEGYFYMDDWTYFYLAKTEPVEEINPIKHIPIKEFREKGFLQEVNRQFFHPIGMALEVYRDEVENEILSGIQDYRDDPEGVYFANTNLPEKSKALETLRLQEEKAHVRVKRFGWVQQPLQRDNDE